MASCVERLESAATDEKVRGSLVELFAAAQLNWRKTVRAEHANADGKPFVYQANKTDSKL